MKRDIGGYLFVTFTGESANGEQVYFSLSRDGMHWEDLNKGQPVLRSDVGEKGIRDPFILRDERENKFYLIATDLCIANKKGWYAAQRSGSRSIIIWESKDLIHWSQERSCEVGIPEAGCVWAPEAVYDEEKGAWFVFWASRVKEAEDSDGKHRIYCSCTNDFRTFSAPQKYIERKSDVIDTTIIHDDGMYYRFSKDETSGNIRMDCGKELMGEFTEIRAKELSSLKGVEGPAAFRLKDGRWCLLVDRFAEELGYLPLVCSSLRNGEFQVPDETQYHMGQGRKRHGSVLSVTEEEYRKLAGHYGTDESLQNPVISGMYADPDIIKYEEKYYMYPSTDGAAHWAETKFYAFSSEDKKHWKNEGLLLDLASEQVPWAVGSAWAPAMLEKDGMFYYYFCGKRRDGKSCIGAAKSASPIKGFTAEPEPMITPELMEQMGIETGQTIDPSVYKENGETYLLFGNGAAAIVKLQEDCVHAKPETLKIIEGVQDFREAITVFKKDDLYHFTWSCDDTRSEDYHVNYGVSGSLYGPVKYQYTILEKKAEAEILGTGHHCIFKDDTEYYIGYHRFAKPLEEYPDGKGYHREVCIDKIEFCGNRILPVKVH